MEGEITVEIWRRGERMVALGKSTGNIPFIPYMDSRVVLRPRHPTLGDIVADVVVGFHPNRSVDYVALVIKRTDDDWLGIAVHLRQNGWHDVQITRTVERQPREA